MGGGGDEGEGEGDGEGEGEGEGEEWGENEGEGADEGEGEGWGEGEGGHLARQPLEELLQPVGLAAGDAGDGVQLEQRVLELPDGGEARGLQAAEDGGVEVPPQVQQARQVMAAGQGRSAGPDTVRCSMEPREIFLVISDTFLAAPQLKR